MKIHYEYTERKCGCGDSFCGECREEVTRVACGAATRSSDQRSHDVKKTTCAQCCATKKYKADQTAEFNRMRTGLPSAEDRLTKVREQLNLLITSPSPTPYVGRPKPIPRWAVLRIVDICEKSFP